MTFHPTPLQGSYIIETNPFSDERGMFYRFFCKKEFASIGHDKEWVQCNHSITAKKGTVRGMHFQLRPHSEIKFIRCIAGAVYDVIVDIRERSPTFLQWVGSELSAENRKMIYVPEGFAHGFQALTDNCELLYFHSEVYNPGFESGINYADQIIGINWPLPVVMVSDRDKTNMFINNQFKGI